MKKHTYAIGVLTLAGMMSSCGGETTPITKTDEGKDAKFHYQAITPTPMPDLNIKGFNFPQDSTTLNRWIKADQIDSIYLHGWGIWTGLTSKTSIKADGEKDFLRVFETWMTPEEMIEAIKTNPKLYRSSTRSNRANLKRPHQFTHFASPNQTINDSIHESVSYNPAASKFAIDNKIFMATSLYDMAKNGQEEVTFFPNNAVTIKPVFKVLPASNGDNKFHITAWNGPKDTPTVYPEQDWASYVTIDIAKNAKQEGSVYPLEDFIHYTLNEEDAHFFNQEFTENSGNKITAKAGDIAVLVGMHVGTREITNWTWQTFWWEDTPDNPELPSSKAIADMRPKELKGAARHYAMAVAYYMVNNNEPYSGTDVTGPGLFAYNPYLEAGFGPSTFDTTLSRFTDTTGKVHTTYLGVKTNCMSCHRMATVNPDSLGMKHNSKTPYVGNAYISRKDSLFNGQLLLDFAWSIQGNIDTTGFKAHTKQ